MDQTLQIKDGDCSTRFKKINPTIFCLLKRTNTGEN